MTTAALTTQGVELQLGDAGSPGNFVAIGEITDFSGPSGSKNVLDVTSLDSTGGYKEKAWGLKDWAQLTANIFYVPQDTQHTQIFDDFTTDTYRYFQIVLTDSPATTYQFRGFVTALQLTVAVDNLVRGSVTIEITGAITDVTA